METNIDHDLVHKLTDAGVNIPHEVRDRIVSQGKRAVPTLLAVVRDELGLDRLESRRPWLHAVTLLGDIKDPDTIEPLLEVLVERPLFYNEREALVATLAALGEPVLEPALRAHAAVAGQGAESAAHPARALARNLATLLARLGVRDERVFALLLDELARGVTHGAELLADYGDPRAVEPLHQAFDRCQIGPGEPRQGIELELFAIETALERLGSKLTAEQRLKYNQIDNARIQHRALAHQREKQARKQHKMAQQKQRTSNRKKNKQQRNSRKKNR